MSELNKQLFYHIDKLREDYQIPINDFVLDICDRRQYSRYLNGSQKISLKNITRFYERLGMSQIEFYYSYYSDENSEFQLVNKLYYSIIEGQLEISKKILLTLEDEKLTGIQTKKYYDFCVVYYNYVSKKLYPEDILQRLRNIVDTKVLFSKKHITFIDMLVIRLICIIECKKKVYTTVHSLHDYIMSKDFKYTTSDLRDVLPSIYSTLARLFGSNGDFDKCLSLSIKGIEFCNSNDSTFLLSNLYYMASLSSRDLDNINDGFKYAKKALYTLDIENNQTKYKKMLQLLNKDYEVNFENLI